MKYHDSMLTLTAFVLLPLSMAACDDDSTGPAANATMSAVVTDGSGSSGSSMASLVAGSTMNATEGSFSGMTSGQARVSVFSESNGWVALGNFQDVEVAMQSSSMTSVHTNASVPADTYTRVRYEFENADSDIHAGANLGSIVLTADVTVSFGGSDGSVTIEKSITPVTLDASTSATVALDLNSEAWVDDDTASGSAATDAEIAAAASAFVSAS